MFYDYSALAFYHKLPPPLPIMEKEEADKLESEGLPVKLAWWPSFRGGSNS
jgi:hypothetical protein